MKSTNASELRSWLDDVLAAAASGSVSRKTESSLQELAIVDVREPGQFGEGHLFFAIPIPFSSFEYRFRELLPRLSTRTVLIDQNDGVATRAATAAMAMGYTDIHVLAGGVEAWQQAGFNLFKGVNVPSKTFGELLEIARETPHISAEALVRRQQDGETITIIDGRPASEFQNMSIPGAACCPNAELAMRADVLVESADSLVVINCAGRTRSILGAQSLIDSGFANPVMALENGTQGWVLAGFELEHGRQAMRIPLADTSVLDSRRQQVTRLAQKAKVEFIGPGKLSDFCADRERTLYLLDVRSLEEFTEAALSGSRHAPGGQLLQATDQWVAVRGARVVLLDSDGIRAPLCAYWLRQLGHEAFVMQADCSVEDLIAGAAAGAGRQFSVAKSEPGLPRDECPSLSVVELSEGCAQGKAAYQIIDLRPSAQYRACHIEGARWSVRPSIERLDLENKVPLLLVGNREQARLVSIDQQAAGHQCFWLTGSDELDATDEWKNTGLPLAASASIPRDEERIDFLFFTAGRHKGNRADSLLYLEWEQDLLNQIDAQERDSFSLV